MEVKEFAKEFKRYGWRLLQEEAPDAAKLATLADTATKLAELLSVDFDPMMLNHEISFVVDGRTAAVRNAGVLHAKEILYPLMDQVEIALGNCLAPVILE